MNIVLGGVRVSESDSGVICNGEPQSMDSQKRIGGVGGAEVDGNDFGETYWEL